MRRKSESGVRRGSVEEKSVERFARAYLRPALFTSICSLKGQTLCGWDAISLHAIGGEGILLRVVKEDKEGLLKMPHLPYDRAAHFGTWEINRIREKLVFEADMLKKFPDTLLPRLLELAVGPNPLLSDRSPKVANNEKFLVMEFIPGQPLDSEIQARLRGPDRTKIQYWLGQWVRQILEFLSKLKSQNLCYFYTDFKPSNVRISPDSKVHLLDGGSITSAGLARGVPITEGYCKSDLLRMEMTNENLEAISINALGRTLYSSLLNKVLYKGMKLDFQPLVRVCGNQWAKWIRETSTGNWCTLEKIRNELPSVL